MKKYSLFGLALLLTFTLLAGPRSADAKTPAALKPLKILVSAVRFGKHKLALTYLADREQGKILVGKAWDKGTNAQRARFQKLFKVLFAKMALRKFQNQYQHLKSIVYSKPRVKGKTAKIDITVVVLHALKKQEVKATFTTVKSGKKWLVLDVATLNGSMLENLHKDQISKILKRGGWKLLLKLMEKRLKGLTHIKLK